MAEEFFERLFLKCIPSVCGIIRYAGEKAGWLLIEIVTSPYWIIPFIFWYFRVYKPKREKERDALWKQQIMRKFERME